MHPPSLNRDFQQFQYFMPDYFCIWDYDIMSMESFEVLLMYPWHQQQVARQVMQWKMHGT